jgi:hypothetical protein
MDYEVRMGENSGFWIETGAAVTAVLLIPAYMGFIHVAPAGAIAYAGLGSVAMAVGEELQFSPHPSLSLWDIGLWAAAIAGAGGTAYVLALLFI